MSYSVYAGVCFDCAMFGLVLLWETSQIESESSLVRSCFDKLENTSPDENVFKKTSLSSHSVRTVKYKYCIFYMQSISYNKD